MVTNFEGEYVLLQDLTPFGPLSYASDYMRDTARQWASVNAENGNGAKLAGSWPGADGKPICAPFGCTQGGPGKFFGLPYNSGGVIDKVLEAFSGPHDFLDRPLYNFGTGNLQPWAGNLFWGNAYAALTLPLAAPFAIAPMAQDAYERQGMLRGVK